MKRGKATDWKKQYRLRHNWSNGSCNISETRVADMQSVPPLMARFHNAVVVTVDSSTGLRAWSMKGENRLLATTVLSSCSDGTVATPTALAIDTSSTESGIIGIAIGFSDGALSIYYFLVAQQQFLRHDISFPSSQGAVEAIAYSSPHLLTMTDKKLLSLYHLDLQSGAEGRGDQQPHPRLLSCLKSYTAWPPFSLAIRSSSINIVASITYATPTYLSGWSVGLQELHLTSEGNILESRLTSAVGHGFTPLYDSQPFSPVIRTALLVENQRIWESSPFLTKPASLSYTHPYILAAHPDNTLIFYVVTSDANNLLIGPGYRLWGHTSSVSSACVGARGKAVSVSRNGDDLRVWELETGLGHGDSNGRAADGGKSVRIRTEKKVAEIRGYTDDLNSKAERNAPHAPIQGSHEEEFSYENGWVAFDDEKVLLLKKEGQGAQMVVAYDFS